MTAKAKQMEQNLIKLSEQIRLARKNRFLSKAEKLQAEYRALHRRWLIAKDQLEMEV